MCVSIYIKILFLPHSCRSHGTNSPSATNEGFGMKKRFGVDDTDDPANGGDDDTGSGGGSGGS